MKRTLAGILALIGAALLCTPVLADGVQEDFESQTVGTTNLPAGWTLIDSSGASDAPVYTNQTGSDGIGGSTGVGGEVKAFRTPSPGTGWFMPGGYIVHDPSFDPTKPIVGTFDMLLVGESDSDTGYFMLGDVASGITQTTGDALIQGFYEDEISGDPRLSGGSGSSGDTLDSQPSQIPDDTWHRVQFYWIPTNGLGGVFACTLFDAVTGAVIGNESFSSYNDAYTFNPSAVQCGFGTTDDKARFDNIAVWGLEEVLNEDFEAQTIGTTTLPTGWILIDTGGDPPEPDAVYTNVAGGSDGAGGDAGVAGQPNNVDVNPSITNALPPVYMVASRPVSASQPFSGSFEIKIPVAYWDWAYLILGDIANGLTQNASDALCLTLTCNSGWHNFSMLSDGAGEIIETGPEIAEGTWHRVDFVWTPYDGKTGDFTVNVASMPNGQLAGSYSVGGFTLNPDWVQLGVGVRTYQNVYKFDNIKLHGTPPPTGSVIVLR